MCMMHAPHNRDIPSVKRREKTVKKHVAFDKEARMKPDPDFIDERRQVKSAPKKGFLDKLADML